MLRSTQTEDFTTTVVCRTVLESLKPNNAYSLTTDDDSDQVTIESTATGFQQARWLEPSVNVFALVCATCFSYAINADDFIFEELRKNWQTERNSLSSSSQDNLLCPSYAAIVGMGWRAVPLILRELENDLMVGEPDDWFVALATITRKNPVPLESRGKPKKMAEAWIQWGKREGLSIDAGVGIFFPQLGQYMGMP